MLAGFFFHLRDAGLKVSINEYLALLDALDAQVIGPGSTMGGASLEDFYYLARTVLVKDESFYDRFDRAFGAYFKGVTTLVDARPDIPLEWLLRRSELDLTPEEKARIEKLGGFDALMKRFRELLDQQHDRHEGGNRWIGTGGTSPYGAYGYNPEGIRIGQDRSRERRAIKVWDERAFKDYDDSVELGTRNIKIALRRLRRFAREGSELELDLEDTISSTARNAGWLDIKLVPERHNNVKVLMLLDVGGSMDDHIRRTEELFSAAKSEFKHLEFFYFHNCVYDYVWKNNRRRHSERTATFDLLHKYGADWKLVFVGDATMSPYEIMQAHGSVEYDNAEPGHVWMTRLLDTFPKAVWLNPEPEGIWQYRQSIDIIQRLMHGRMFPVTINGLERAMRQLAR
ncbi:MAG TPA: VWA domain-containing protein [Burkholderiaceae bacterium]|nr:VWA domain-containing protein [Burkholderiaceae bacterium]